MSIREALEQRELETLAPQAAKSAASRGRLRPEPEDDVRPAFQHDRDRIIHSKAFRRLKHKTQVFFAPAGDHYRTRLTHSIEVAQIGRSICHYLQTQGGLLSSDFFIDGDLVEGVCLAHDLGHPPFGHSGERTLQELMMKWGGFEGNAQTLHLLTKTMIQNETSVRGIQPTRALLDGVLKYKKLFSEFDSPPSKHFLYNPQVAERRFVLGGTAQARPGVCQCSIQVVEPAVASERLAE